ncbi:hypothetical protein [Spirillospora sp. CA-128828]|uniref:hypothetical protein n=1 Tax=Spirillospora sp. CA-128828 TaxID=3240033 RepID=UPI003D94A8E2
MDPVTVIAAAVVAGAAAGMNEVMNTAARDAYETLRGLLRRRLGGDEQAQAALDAPVPEEPEEEDALADSTGPLGKYAVTITDSHNIIVGDHAHQVSHPPHDGRPASEATPTPE